MRNNAARPRLNEVLRALREARGITLDGWGARLGVSRTTVVRWERGERTPDPGAETAIIAYCREAALFRAYDRAPLAGVTLTAELLQDLLSEARWRMGGRSAGAAPHDDSPASVRTEDAPHDLPRASPPNLPAQLTSFIGREREIAAVRRLQAGTRLLTLTGAGGCGKTRLALAVADELVPAYPHGVWFVDLAPLADPALLPQAVGSALAIRPIPQHPITETLIEALGAGRHLLLLDNCEHLLPACAALVEGLLRACPHVAVLATSRASLGIGGETVWRVPPMALPDGEHREPATGDSTQAPEAADAVRLFVERARLQRSEFGLTHSEAGAVAEICRRLDGIPLAVELAAARVNVLSVEQIADRLNDRFQLLTGGSRTALRRHQTLRAAMDWSYEMLTAPEQAVLRSLAVFAGGCTLEAAEAVCSTASSDSDPGVIHAVDVLDLLARLVDQSLVIADVRNGVVRYRMLETVRQYAAEQLAAAGEAPATHDLHVAWYAALAEASVPHRTGSGQHLWMEQLTVEHDNVRAALGWCLAQEHAAVEGLRLAASMWWIWELRGYLSEGRRWLNALLARGGDAPADVRALALNSSGWLAQSQGDYDEATRLHEQSLALERERGDEAGVAASLNNLGVVANSRGDYAGARELYDESLALQRKLGNRRAVATAMNNLGVVARRQGDLDRAAALLEESLAVQRELGDTRGIAMTLQNLGNVDRDRGVLERAAALYRESLALDRELQDRLGAARCLEGLAAVAAADGTAERAARLCGAAAALREAIGVPAHPAGRATFERTAASARAALGEAAFTAAWAAGDSLSLEEAIAEALSEPAPD